jgi:hypothetical protein
LGKNNGVGNHELGVRLALEVLEAVDRLLSHAELGLVPMSAIAAMGKDIKRRVCMLDAQRRGPSRPSASGREPCRPWPLRMHQIARGIGPQPQIGALQRRVTPRTRFAPSNRSSARGYPPVA